MTTTRLLDRNLAMPVHAGQRSALLEAHDANHGYSGPVPGAVRVGRHESRLAPELPVCIVCGMACPTAEEAAACCDCGQRDRDREHANSMRAEIVELAERGYITSEIAALLGLRADRVNAMYEAFRWTTKKRMKADRADFLAWRNRLRKREGLQAVPDRRKHRKPEVAG